MSINYVDHIFLHNTTWLKWLELSWISLGHRFFLHLLFSILKSHWGCSKVCSGVQGLMMSSQRWERSKIWSLFVPRDLLDHPNGGHLAPEKVTNKTPFWGSLRRTWLSTVFADRLTLRAFDPEKLPQIRPNFSERLDQRSLQKARRFQRMRSTYT